MQKVIVRTCLTRFGVRRFESEVNKVLESKYALFGFSIQPKFLRTVCYAILDQIPQPSQCEDNGK